MAAEVDICNLALAHLGDEATVSSINPPEGSAQAEHCARFYPVARDALLEEHTWSFSTRRVTAALVEEEPTSTWLFAYEVPSGCIKVFAVLPPDATDDTNTQPYEEETLSDGTQVIYTNQEDAELRFTKRITDTTKFSPLFTNCLARLLASYLAGPVLKGDVGRTEAKGQYQLFLVELSKAKTSDANKRKPGERPKPSSIKARG